MLWVHGHYKYFTLTVRGPTYTQGQLEKNLKQIPYQNPYPPMTAQRKQIVKS